MTDGGPEVDVNKAESASFLFFGDFAPVHAYEPMSRDPNRNVFAGVEELIASSSFSFVNLETVLAETGAPIWKDGPHLRAHPDCAGALARAGITVAGLANNHTMDFGPEGLEATVGACAEHGIVTCGAGLDLSAAQRTPIFRTADVSIALIAVAEEEFNAAGPKQAGVAIADPIATARRIREASLQAEVVVVTLHGGNEMFPLPRPGLRQFCQFLIEMGAHAVVCHHNHMPSPYEYHLGRPIVYGLGNVLFDYPGDLNEWGDSYAARLSMRRSIGGSWEALLDIVPLHQSPSWGGVRIAVGDDRMRILKNINCRRSILEDHEAYARQWEAYCRARRLDLFLKMFVPVRFPGIGRLTRLLHLEKWFMPRSRAADRLNAVRCTSHREVLVSLLEADLRK